MRTNTQPIPTDQTLQLLADYRRRKIIHTISKREGRTVALEELAAEIDGADGHSNDGCRAERTKTELYHNYLPKLAEHDIIAWDRGRDVVSDGSAFEAVESVLALVDGYAAEVPTDYLSEGT